MKNFNPIAWCAAAVMLLACMLAVCSSAKAGCGGQLQVQQFVQPYAAQQVFVQPFVVGHGYALQLNDGYNAAAQLQQLKLQQQLNAQKQHDLQQQLKDQSRLQRLLDGRRGERQVQRQRSVTRSR